MEKKKTYYPAGGRSQSSNASSVTYNNSNSGIEATNVQQAIDALAQGGGGGGESNVLIINVLADDVTTDKSFSEVATAVNAGKTLVFKLNSYDEGVLIDVQACTAWFANGDFSNIDPSQFHIGFYYQNNTEYPVMYSDDYQMQFDF